MEAWRPEMLKLSAILDLYTLFVLTTENLGRGLEVENQLRFKSDETIHVEFILRNMDVMTHGCLSSVAQHNSD